MPKIIQNGTVYGASASSLSGLTDTTITNPSAGQSLVYSNGSWINQSTIWKGTQAQYNAITTPDPNVTYFITDGTVTPVPATNISYNNTTSGLSATQVQSAIDEVCSKTFKQLYAKSTYQNDVGQTIALSETSANFRFLRILFYINDMTYTNAGMLLLANIQNNIQIQHFPLCINTTLGSVRLDLYGTSLKLYSTSFGSTMFVYQVVGIY